jgi:hypothetical protein
MMIGLKAGKSNLHIQNDCFIPYNDLDKNKKNRKWILKL